MKHKRNLVAPLLLLPALMAMESRGESPAFSPSEGTSLDKRVENQTDISLDEMSMMVGGQDFGEMLSGMEVETSVVVVTAVTDTYGQVADGRPTKLKRSFTELSSSTEVSSSNPMAPTGDQDMEIGGSSELEGTTVHFSWDADAEEYTVAFDEESDADEDLLEGLREDMDLRGFLPDDEVSAGDAWDVDPSALLSVFAPSGAVKIEPDDVEEMGMGMGSGSPSNLGEFLDEYEGEVTAKFESVEGDIAIISLTIDVASSSDMTEWMNDMMAQQEMPDGMEMEMDVESFDMEFTFEGEGELRWNLGAGHFDSLTLEGDIEQILDTAMNLNMGGMEQAIEQSMTFSGTQKIQYTAGE